jgi:hypothetical protein
MSPRCCCWTKTSLSPATKFINVSAILFRTELLSNSGFGLLNLLIHMAIFFSVLVHGRFAVLSLPTEQPNRTSPAVNGDAAHLDCFLYFPGLSGRAVCPSRRPWRQTMVALK